MTLKEGRLVCDHCGERIPQEEFRHTWIGPVAAPGEDQRHYHLALVYPDCRAAGGADPAPGGENVILEDLNAVHGLTREIERLRAGEEAPSHDGTRSTPGQLWGRLLDLNETRRIEMLRSLLQSADEGARCAMEGHASELEDQHIHMGEALRELREWNTARRLITIFIGTLRKDQEGPIERGTVADKLELFLRSGSGGSVDRTRRVTCGHTWTEAGREFECAEPVDRAGFHQGQHHAYVCKGSAADEELRMRYLKEENRELRARLGLPPNPGR